MATSGTASAQSSGTGSASYSDSWEGAQYPGSQPGDYYYNGSSKQQYSYQSDFNELGTPIGQEWLAWTSPSGTTTDTASGTGEYDSNIGYNGTWFYNYETQSPHYSPSGGLSSEYGYGYPSTTAGSVSASNESDADWASGFQDSNLFDTVVGFDDGLQYVIGALPYDGVYLPEFMTPAAATPPTNVFPCWTFSMGYTPSPYVFFLLNGVFQFTPVSISTLGASEFVLASPQDLGLPAAILSPQALEHWTPVVPDHALADLQAEEAAQNQAGSSTNSQPAGQPTYTYNDNDQLTQITDANSGVTSLAYDPNTGVLTSLTDPKGNYTSWTYYSDSNPTETGAYPNKLATEFTPTGTSYFGYDSAGNLNSYTDADGRVTSYQYDSQNRVTTETAYADATDADANGGAGQYPTEILTYAYDPATGNVAAESDTENTYDGSDNLLSSYTTADYYTYNDAGQVASAVETMTGGPAVQLTYSYNTAGQCSGVAASIGGSVDSSGDYTGGTLDYQDAYTYNAAGQLCQIDRSGQSGGDAVAEQEIDIQYNAAGQYQSIQRYLYPDGILTLAVQGDYTYNSAGQLTGLVYHQGSSVLAQYTYGYSGGADGGLSQFRPTKMGLSPSAGCRAGRRCPSTTPARSTPAASTSRRRPAVC